MTKKKARATTSTATEAVRVTLSFDNGPHPEGTPWVLERLRRRGLTAHFFVLGKHLETDAGRRLVEQIHAAGHHVGNHSFSHEIPLGRDERADAVEREMERTERLLETLGVSERRFRPFGGGGAVGPHLLSRVALDWLRRRRMTCVLWNVVPGDFRDEEGWVERGLAEVPRHRHALVVLHDAKPLAMRHLDRFLDGLEARGCSFDASLPSSCLLVEDGLPRPGADAFVTDASAG